MRQTVERRARTALTCAVLLIAGCAPRPLERAVGWYAARERVSDASVRRTRAAWFLRFDAEALADLDAAIAAADSDAGRALAHRSLERAGRLAVRSFEGEIERLSPDSRAQLAERAGCPADAAELARVLSARAAAELSAERRTWPELSAGRWQARLRQIRGGVEPLPDERGRLSRQLLLAPLAPVVSAGIAGKEEELQAAVRSRSEAAVERVALWEPPGSTDTPRSRWAPRLAVVWPEQRDYPDDFDRIGSVALSGTPANVRVSVDPARPALYTYASTATIRGERYRQLAYVWWFSDRPEMSPDDPAAGHIDGGTLRLTLDRDGRPAVAEVIMNCGCEHQVFVAAEVESAARAEFGAPLEGARFATERRTADARPILVAGTFDRDEPAARPLVVLRAGTHEPLRFVFSGGVDAAARTVVERRAYAFRDYEALDRIPLGDGVASMFGPDGLVHFAGRPEGYLLAPSGMLSAGQPRKRGTQRIRWDAYLFDDPTLLERTLRLPSVF